MVLSLESGRSAIERRQWDEALQTLSTVDRDDPLGPDDLRLLADAAWWSGRPDDAVSALERAFAGYEAAGMAVAAAEVGLLLAYLAVRRNAFAVGSGWHARAARLLEGVPESSAHATLLEFRVIEALGVRNDLDNGIRFADEAIEVARRTGAVDVEAELLAFKGSALAAAGRWQEGLALVDEAAATALSGALSLRSASHVYCITIATCHSLADFTRAAEWTDEAERWMREEAVAGYPEVCQVHRAELKRLHGAWPEAEAVARGACDRLRRYRILDGARLAYDEIGEIRLRMGDLEGADEAFRSAYELGSEAQPGMALLMLARGRKEEAARGIARALAERAADGGGGTDLVALARLLPAQVEIALAVDDVDAAASAADELRRIADEFARPAFEAAAEQAAGQVALHRGDASAAAADAERAVRLWRDLDFPYETARSRVVLGRARLAAGDDDRARVDLDAARVTFGELGAIADLRGVETLLRPLDRPDAERDRVTRTFMFTDIVTSTDLVDLIGDEAWEALLAWHDRELRKVFAAHGGIEVSHTGDGFFVSFERPGAAIDAAVAAQRRLLDHRREHGFAPSVRIGVHTAEATVEGDDYRGHGVHVAARVAAAAQGNEILVSASALVAGDGDGHPVSPGRAVELKGLREPVEVHAVDWRRP